MRLLLTFLIFAVAVGEPPGSVPIGLFSKDVDDQHKLVVTAVESTEPATLPTEESARHYRVEYALQRRADGSDVSTIVASQIRHMGISGLKVFDVSESEGVIYMLQKDFGSTTLYEMMGIDGTVGTRRFRFDLIQDNPANGPIIRSGKLEAGADNTLRAVLTTTDGETIVRIVTVPTPTTLPSE